jgi:hypothetical protein
MSANEALDDRGAALLCGPALWVCLVVPGIVPKQFPRVERK